jgi:hypothetical protein
VLSAISASSSSVTFVLLVDPVADRCSSSLMSAPAGPRRSTNPSPVRATLGSVWACGRLSELFLAALLVRLAMTVAVCGRRGDPTKARCCDWCYEHLIVAAQERRKEVARWKEELRG